MGQLVIAAESLVSRAVRSTVGANGNGIRVIGSRATELVTKSGNVFFDTASRFVGWILNSLGGLVRWALSSIVGAFFQNAINLYYFDWNQSDKAIEESIKSNNLALTRSAGNVAGEAAGWLVCGAVAAGIELTIPVMRGKVLVQIAEQGIDSVGLAFNSFVNNAVYTMGQNSLLWAYSHLREKLNPNGDYNKPGAKPYILADKAQKAVESIKDEYQKEFARGFLSGFENSVMQCFYTIGYVVQMAVDDHLAVQKHSVDNALGKERVVEITPNADIKEEKIRLSGKTQLLKGAIANTIAMNKIVGHRDIGMVVGQPADDFMRAKPQIRQLVIVFRNKQYPPFTVKNAKGVKTKARSVTYTIPDAKPGLSWEKIKKVASHYEWGAHCATVKLDNGRYFKVYGATKKIAESKVNDFLTLTTAHPLEWNFHEEGTKKNPALVKKPMMIFPHSATLLVRKPTAEGAGNLNTIDGRSYDEQIQRFELWPDTEPKGLTLLH